MKTLGFPQSLNIILIFEKTKTSSLFKFLKEMGFKFDRENGSLSIDSGAREIYQSPDLVGGEVFFYEKRLIQKGDSDFINRIKLEYLFAYLPKENIKKFCALTEKIVSHLNAKLECIENNSIGDMRNLENWALHLAEITEKKYFPLGSQELSMVIDGHLIL